MKQINKITISEEPELFQDLLEMEIDREENHRRASSFYVDIVVEFKEQHKEYYPNIKNFYNYIGFWKTNNFVIDSEYGITDDEPYELTRVIKKEVMKPITIWEKIKDE